MAEDWARQPSPSFLDTWRSPPNPKLQLMRDTVVESRQSLKTLCRPTEHVMLSLCERSTNHPWEAALSCVGRRALQRRILASEEGRMAGSMRCSAAHASQVDSAVATTGSSWPAARSSEE